MTDTVATSPTTREAARPLERRYLRLRGRIVALVTEAGEDAARSTPVPACRGGRAHAALAPVAGVATGGLGGRRDGVPPGGGRKARAGARRDTPVGDIATEWETVASDFAAIV